jgi:single-strand DNA-binding protein
MLNRTQIIGHLGRDPEVRYTADGKAIANLAVATSEPYKDRETGERKKHTEWHRIVLFGRQADVAKEFLKKGSLVYVEGRLRTRKWQKDGQERFTTEIVGTELTLLDRKPSAEAGRSTGASEEISTGSTHYEDDFDEAFGEIPL